ncbi:MAG: hypothetical protein LUC98_13690 [Lachnospiraceae bacterium]|nr:hypothetical protein [Lachnospiraceae bacterium]
MEGKRRGRDRKSRQRRNIRIAAVSAVLTLALVLTWMLGGNLYAKYVRSQTEYGETDPAAFYFYSNLLTESGTASYIYPEGTEDISFTLYNYEDELRSSECDITYEVTLTGVTDPTVSLNLSDANVIDGNGTVVSTAILTGNQQSIHTITFSGLAEGTYIITAKATSPYIAELTAEFTLRETSDDIDVIVVDNGSGYANVKVTVTVNQGGDVIITWPSGVVPDTTDFIFNGVSITYNTPGDTFSGGSAEIEFKDNASYTFNFLKQYTTSIYSNSDFEAEYST